MVDYTFRNATKDSHGFFLGNRKYSWKADSEMVVSIVDTASIATRVEFQRMKKSAATFSDLIDIVKLIVHTINEEFPEGSTGYEINFKEPKKIPEISVDMVTNFMYVGDEMTFKVITKNFEGEVFAATGDKKAAIVLPDKSGSTLKATGPGRTHLIVGNKEYNRRFEVNVESRPESEVKDNE